MLKALLHVLKHLLAGEPRVEVRQKDATARAPGNGRPAKATVCTRSKPRSARAGGVTVQPDARPYWVLRGWRKVNGKLVGAYRTRLGSCAGQIEFDRLGNPSFYVINPPAAVLKGSHGACFRQRQKGLYWIHFNCARDVDGGIVAVEEIVARALGC